MLSDRSTDRNQTPVICPPFWLRAVGPVLGRMQISHVFASTPKTCLQDPLISPLSSSPAVSAPLSTHTPDHPHHPLPPSASLLLSYSPMTTCLFQPQPSMAHLHPCLPHPSLSSNSTPHGTNLNLTLLQPAASRQPSATPSRISNLACNVLQGSCWLACSACEVVKPLGFGV